MSVGYVYSQALEALADRLPCHRNRSSTVHSLIRAFGFLDTSRLKIIHPDSATCEELCRFHSDDYLDTLFSAEENKDNHDLLEEYGLVDDASVFPGLADYCKLVAGSTISAAKCLISGQCSIVINWDGGRHHAHRDRAAGFCYVNDIVLGIMELQQRFRRVMYIDLDVHHGDGVQEAFEYSPRVLTVSFHRYDRGMYPGTGLLDDIGKGKGRYHTINIPFAEGTSGSTLLTIFIDTISKAVSSYEPEAIVLQCGADSLSDDPLGGHSNVDILSFGKCVSHVLSFQKPTLMLGGGGYINTSASRCWSYCTAIALAYANINHTLIDEDKSCLDASLISVFPAQCIQDDNAIHIPEHSRFLEYGPDFQLFTEHKNRIDSNDAEAIETILERVTKNLDVLHDRYH